LTRAVGVDEAHDVDASIALFVKHVDESFDRGLTDRISIVHPVIPDADVCAGNVVLRAGFEEVQPADGVGHGGRARVHDGLLGTEAGREVDDAVHVGGQFGHRDRVHDVAEQARDTRVVAAAAAEVVEDPRGVAALAGDVGDVPADEPGTAGDSDTHGGEPSRQGCVGVKAIDHCGRTVGAGHARKPPPGDGGFRVGGQREAEAASMSACG
jgi:hypothetical protein